MNEELFGKWRQPHWRVLLAVSKRMERLHSRTFGRVYRSYGEEALRRIFGEPPLMQPGARIIIGETTDQPNPPKRPAMRSEND